MADTNIKWMDFIKNLTPYLLSPKRKPKARFLKVHVRSVGAIRNMITKSTGCSRVKKRIEQPSPSLYVDQKFMVKYIDGIPLKKGDVKEFTTCGTTPFRIKN